MRKHRCPGGVKVARFPGMSEVSGSIPVSGLCFLLIFVVFTLCLPCHSSLLSACTVRAIIIETLSVGAYQAWRQKYLSVGTKLTHALRQI